MPTDTPLRAVLSGNNMCKDKLGNLDDRGLAGELELHFAQRRKVNFQLRVQVERAGSFNRVGHDIFVGQGGEILFAAVHLGFRQASAVSRAAQKHRSR